MKATGIVRRIDDLGRVVIPKEIRRVLKIREGDPLEIFTNRDGEVIFKKYSPIGELGEFASQYAEALSKQTDCSVCITDRDVIIALSGASKKELSEKGVSADLEKLMAQKDTYAKNSAPAKPFFLCDGNDKYIVNIACPIISEGDCIGCVVLFSDGKTATNETDEKLASVAAGFLGRHMEE